MLHNQAPKKNVADVMYEIYTQLKKNIRAVDRNDRKSLVQKGFDETVNQEIKESMTELLP